MKITGNTKIVHIISGILIFLISVIADTSGQTEILKWKDGKSSCISITFDDGTRNQLRIAAPLLDELVMPGTFYINTTYFHESRYHPTFIGRPIMDILNESATVPSGISNIYERTSMIRYLLEVVKVPEISNYDMYRTGNNLERKRYDEAFRTVDEICSILRKTNRIFTAVPVRMIDEEINTSWNELAGIAKKGHEFACHTISHPNLSNLDRTNILYELEKCREDIMDHLGFKHTLSVECPYGNHDPRVLEITSEIFPFLRNTAPEKYIDEILRNNSKMPAKTDKEYIQWQRGPLSKTPYSLMTSWVDTTISSNAWLVLVFHGIEEIGWEPLPAETIRNYFTYIKDHEEDVWVATFQDGYKYIRERMSTRITESQKGEKMLINISNDLDRKIYDLPLTLKTNIPENWKTVKIRQGKMSKVISPIKQGGANYIIFEALPGKVPIRLSKAS